MKPRFVFGCTVILLTAICSKSAMAGTSVKINSASVDVPGKMLYLNGINFEAYGPVTVTIGNTLLEGCAITDTTIACSLEDTPPVSSGMATWNVSISAGNAPHANAGIDVFIPTESISQSCPVSSFVECYSGEDLSTRNVGACHTGFGTCSGNGTWSACEGEETPQQELCDDSIDNDCDGHTDCDADECVDYADCNCDPLTQNCSSDADECLINLSTGTSECVIPVDPPGQQGDTCAYLNSCDKGYSCIAPSPNYVGSTCAYICDASGSGGQVCGDSGGPGDSYTCVAIKDIWNNVDDIPDGWGACIDCAEFPEACP